jgi:hypothetical protein
LNITKKKNSKTTKKLFSEVKKAPSKVATNDLPKQEGETLLYMYAQNCMKESNSNVIFNQVVGLFSQTSDDVSSENTKNLVEGDGRGSQQRVRKRTDSNE